MRQQIKHENAHDLHDDDSNIPASPRFEDGNFFLDFHSDQLFEGLPNDIIFVKSLKAPGTPAGNCLNQLNPVYTKYPSP